MFQALTNVFKIAELRNKVLFTLGMLVVYRIGHWIPLPGVLPPGCCRAAGANGRRRTMGYQARERVWRPGR